MKSKFLKAGSSKRQGGYTLIEAGFAIAIASIIAAAGLTVVSKKADNFRVEKAQQEMKQWLEASMQYRIDTGTWPANAAALTGGNYMPTSAVTGPFGGNYTIEPVASNARVRVSYTAPEAKFANLISASLPLANVSGTTVTGEVVVPGAESAHEGLLPRDGSRAMTGNLNMGGNSINSAANVGATGNISADGEVVGNLFRDRYSGGYYVQPRGSSRLNHIQVDSIYSPAFYDANNTDYRVDPNGTSVLNSVYAYGSYYVGAITDINNGNFYLDPNGTSELNYVHAHRIYDRTKGVDNDEAVHNVYNLGENGIVYKPSCYSWNAPRIYTAVSSASNGSVASPMAGVQTFAIDRGSYWTVHMRVYVAGTGTYVSPSAPYGQILAFTKCE